LSYVPAIIKFFQRGIFELSDFATIPYSG